MKKAVLVVFLTVSLIAIFGCSNANTPLADSGQEATNSDQSTVVNDNTNESSVEEDIQLDLNAPQWDGTYDREYNAEHSIREGEQFTIQIKEFNGETFKFSVIDNKNGKFIYTGTATLDPTNELKATFEAVGFVLGEDFSSVEFVADVGSDWDFVQGIYQQIS
jgi:uncharacterized protein (DUF2147 family)